jgi:hypothetical protein
MQPVSQPAVDIQRHDRIVDGPDSAFVQGHRVLPKLLEETLAQAGCLDEKGSLPFCPDRIHEHGHIDDILVDKNAEPSRGPVER